MPAGSAGANSSGAAGGSTGNGIGGSGGGMPWGVSAALVEHRTLVLLRLARCIDVQPIWRSYLPEVPPA